MNFSSPIVHQIDTRQNNTFTVFDGSRDDENKLAKQFWNSVLLMPPVESTLVCKEIKQKTKHRPLHEKPPKFPPSVVKIKQEKSMKDKEFDEAAVIKTNEDEQKRIQLVRDRHQQIRQLFFKHATNNRAQKEKVSIRRTSNFSIDQNHDDFIETFRQDELLDRDLVRFLPD